MAQERVWGGGKWGGRARGPVTLAALVSSWDPQEDARCSIRGAKRFPSSLSFPLLRAPLPGLRQPGEGFARRRREQGVAGFMFGCLHVQGRNWD